MNDIFLIYANLDEAAQRAIAYTLAIIGGVAAAAMNKHSEEMTRAPYFFITSVLFAATVAVNSIWLYEERAISNGYGPWLMIMDVGCRISIGFALAYFSMGRALNAYGSRNKAVYAFIPIANIVLMARAPKTSVYSYTPPTSTAAPILLALLIYGTSIVANAFVLVTIEDNAKAIQNDPRRFVSVAYGVGGVEGIWRRVVDSNTVPARVDNVTTLVEVSANGRTLRYKYQLDASVTSINPAFAPQLRSRFCQDPLFNEAVMRGGSIELFYMGANGRLIEGVFIDQC